MPPQESASGARAANAEIGLGHGVERGLKHLIRLGIGQGAVKTVEHFGHHFTNFLGRVGDWSKAKFFRMHVLERIADRWCHHLGEAQLPRWKASPVKLRN